jgi:hypothetical protein
MATIPWMLHVSTINFPCSSFPHVGPLPSLLCPDIVFGDKVPSGVGEETIDIQALKTLGDTTLRAFQKSLSSGQSQSQCARSYTVRSGDLCDGISAAQHSSTFQLANANQGVINADCSNLAAGKVRAPVAITLHIDLFTFDFIFSVHLPRRCRQRLFNCHRR